jgi:bleomycin hydrolase
LREHALVLRQLYASLRSGGAKDDDDSAILQTVRAKKEKLLSEIWSIMTATLGVPPRPDEPFTYDYYDKDGKPLTWTGTPLEFYKQFRSEKYPVSVLIAFFPMEVLDSAVTISQPAECFSLINDPRNPYKKLYTVDKLGNLWGGRPVLCTQSIQTRFPFSLTNHGP